MALERLANRAPVRSQSLTVVSCEADARSWPSGENTTELTILEWPSNVCRQVPVRSQSLMVLSSEADASSWPSGENTTELTEPEWP